MAVDLFDTWLDPIETAGRARACEFIEEMIRDKRNAVLARPRYERSKTAGDEGRGDGTLGQEMGPYEETSFSCNRSNC
jgi:hypothetical protein